MKKNEAEKIIEQTKKNYDQIASAWDATRQHLWLEMERFLEYVSENDSVVDVGCGNARLLKLLDFVKVDYIGIDNSKGLLEIAQKRYPERKFIESTMMSLPLADNTADVVFCIAALHHIPSKANRHQAVVEMLRILKPGGKLLMTNWHYSCPSFTSKMLLGFIPSLFSSKRDVGDIFVPWQAQQMRYVHLFSASGLHRLLSAVGFVVVEQRVQKASKRGYSNLVTIAQKRYNKDA